MDALRAVQFLTDLAYLALGIAAVGAALRSRERAHVDVALLFGALAITTGLQEPRLLSCNTNLGCVSLPLSDVLSTILILVVPYALLRLLDDVVDVPRWQMWVSLVGLIALAALLILAGASPPPLLILLLTVYLVVGTCYAAFAFGRIAQATLGITRRRMAAVAWGCGLLAAALVLGVLALATPDYEPVLTPLVRLSGLVSGLCFWAGFFPPYWLSQTWRLPELLGYLRPTRLMAAPEGLHGVATDAMAIERLCAATAATTGARRVLLIREDPARDDFYIWGVPTARIASDDQLIQRLLHAGSPLVVNAVTSNRLPQAVAGVFTAETLPRTAIFAPIAGNGHNAGILAAFAEKGPMFVEDDRQVVSFFAGEAAVILRMQYYRQSVSELEALREADRLKDEFMAVVSHELRTPLTAITGYSDILLRKLSGPLNEKQERQVLGVREAARRLLALINDLLDVSKLEAGTLDLHLSAIDAAGAIERAAAGVRVIGSNKGVSVLTREPPPELPAVWADDERLQQILTNLLMNAIKFTPEAGTVWISAETESGAAGPEVVVRVADTGVGLMPGQESRVWERFYQAESSSTRRFGGAGLGLSIVRRMTELHGGRVEASSRGVNLGSTFAVHLPAAAVDEPVIVQPRTPGPSQSVDTLGGNDAATPNRPVVLVVEDDVHIATVLHTYLEADGYRVKIAEDGQSAIQLAHELLPFAITLDISLPKLDGWSVLNALKRDPDTSKIPIVVVSIVDNRDFGLVLGANEYMVKPIDPDRLRGVLRGLDGSHPPGDGSLLIVDDDPALRDVLSSLLTEDGWRVATAGDGQAALSAIARERPTAVVLDLMMPRIDGFEVLRTLREEPATRDLPVIVVTARELTEDDRQRLARSAQRVLYKQVMPLEDLRREIRGLLVARHRGE
jgi:signal transduction histidine kinase/CheY-like chemotaxis protein